MIRSARITHIKPGMLEAYRDAHDRIPQEVVDAMAACGFTEFEIFYDPKSGALFSFVEYEDEEKQKHLADYPCSHAWWKLMTQYLVCKNENDERAESAPLERIYSFRKK